MRLALVSDLHGQKTALEYLRRIITKFQIDGFIFCGDITQNNDVSYLKEIFDVLKQSKKNGFMIWGNSDEQQVQEMIQNSKFNIHQKLRNYGGYKIIGLGETDQPVAINAKELKGAILITHKPPLRKLLMTPYANAPKYHVSGHLHSAKYVKKYPATTVIQVPTLQIGEFVLFDTNDGKISFQRV